MITHCMQNFNDEKKLQSVFAAHGPVVSCVITKGPNGFTKGFGFVEFKRSDHAEA